MLEWMMLVSIGFLAGCLIVVACIPLVHSRAVRLTARRCNAATPLSVAEMQAEKDLLRAEFAMTNRRLELMVEETRTKAAELLRQLGHKAAEIHRLKGELAKAAAPDEPVPFPRSLLERAS